MKRYYDRKAVSGQLVSYLPDSYAERTSRPIYALMYLLGFMAVFVVGTLLIQPNTLSQSLAEPQVRVVAFLWILVWNSRIGEYLQKPGSSMDRFGFRRAFPVFTVAWNIA